MSVPTQSAVFALSEQLGLIGNAGTYTPPTNFYKYRATGIQIGTANMEEDLPFQISGDAVTPGVIRNGSFFNGKIDMFIPLENAFGHILKGITGNSKTVLNAKWNATNNSPELSGTTTGVNTHVFTYNTNESTQPYYAIRYRIPGHTASDTWSEEAWDCKFNAMTISMNAGSLPTASVSIVGRESRYPDSDTANAWTYHNQYDDVSTIPHSGSSSFKLAGVQYPITNVEFSIVNNITNPQQEMVVGKRHPDNFTTVSRTVKFRFTYKWEGDDLARKIMTGSASGISWTAMPLLSKLSGLVAPLEAVFKSQSLIGETAVNHEMRIQGNASNIRIAGPPQLISNNIVMVPFEGTLVAPDSNDFFRIVLVNDAPDYAYLPSIVSNYGYTVFDWDASNVSTLYQDSAKTTPVTANSDPVGAWVDGVQGVDAIQATTANKPTYATASLNGLPTLGFDGGDLLSTANISISTFAVWVVYNASSGTIVYQHEGNVPAGFGSELRRTGISYGRLGAKSVKTFTIQTGALLARHEGNSTNTSHKIFFNGVEPSTTNTNTDDPGSSSQSAILTIGADKDSSLFLTGNIAHLCIVSPYPSQEIIDQMEDYINSKWEVYNATVSDDPILEAQREGYTVYDWDASDTMTLFQDSAMTTPVLDEGDPIGAWLDRISGVKTVQTTTANKPTLVKNNLGGYSVVNFNGNDVLVHIDNLTIGTFAIWAIVDINGTNKFIYEHSVSASSNDGMFLFASSTSNTMRIFTKRSGAASDKYSTSAFSGNFELYRHENNGTAATNHLYQNNTKITLDTPTVNIGTGSTSQPFFIGARSTAATNGFVGSIAQLVVVTPRPDDNTIQAIETHLRNKWQMDDAIALASASGYDVWDWDATRTDTLFKDSSATQKVLNDGDPVGAWVDRISGVNATQGTTSNKPTYTTASLNGLPTLSFDGGDYLQTAVDLSINTFAMFFVVDFDNAAYLYVHNSTGTNGSFLANFASLSSRVMRAGPTSQYNAGGSWLNNLLGLVRHEYAGTNATHKIYVDNVDQTPGWTNSQALDPGTGSINGKITMMARNDGLIPSAGNIAQLVIVTPYPTQDIIDKIEAQINERWNIY